MTLQECPRCEGSGEIDDVVSRDPALCTTIPCALCEGSGVITERALNEFEEWLAEREEIVQNATWNTNQPF